MRSSNSKVVAAPRGLLVRLSGDVGGNTLAIMAATLIPLAGLVGGGIDISRMYITKTRLQHACDAGTLAGRKAMGSGTWAQSNYAPQTTANLFFDSNFQSTAYGSEAVVRDFSESAGKVTGKVRADLPMTLMKIFGRPTERIEVTCDAEMRLPNTDIMFVLDTTGSMSDTPSGDTQSKMAGLRVAVKCFYEIVARLDTDATCVNGAPSGGTGTQVQIRFGFVPYSTNVNVGRLLPTNYFADSWSYQSRSPIYATTTSNTYVQQGNPVVTNQAVSVTNVAESQCNDQSAAAAGYNSSSDAYSNNNNTKVHTDVVTTVTGWNRANGGTCNGNQRTTKTTYQMTTTTSTAFSKWHYDQIAQNVSGLKGGMGWNTSFSLPLGANGTAKTITWDGCIEERATTRTTNYSPIPAAAADLDIDLTPTGDANSKWGFALPGLLYTRQGSGTSTSNWNTAATDTTTDYGNGSAYACPTAAKKLQSWTNATTFGAYVDSLQPNGTTYHDIGMLWGARLISPTGIFGTENDLTPEGGEIERNIIFMTDGDTNTEVTDYNAYGIPWFDRRQTDASAVPTKAQTDAQVDLRFAALCAAIKNKNITLWVVSFGSVADDTKTRLTNCASAGRYFSASNSSTLQTTFAQIADQISQLRLTR